MKVKNKFRLLIITGFFFLFPSLIFSSSGQETILKNDRARIMFYNVENLFDIYDDSLTRDEEFTPDGERRWNNHRFYNKLNNIYKVIMAVGQWEPPAIIGLCEIENRSVLEKLIYETPLKKYGYRIIHHESPDRRGIDVALLYREGHFIPFHHEPVEVFFPDDTSRKTRDILYVKGLLFDKEMIHIFVNHWPSRYGGYMASKPSRETAALTLKTKTDSLFKVNPNLNILIMGDFNDNPEDESIKNKLAAESPAQKIEAGKLYNLMQLLNDQSFGSLKYREGWDIFDQIIVSGNLLNPAENMFVNNSVAKIFKAEFLLETDKSFYGNKPFRTYTGFKYTGGYSDHLPIYLDLKTNNNLD
jgi:hypothetical protein